MAKNARTGMEANFLSKPGAVIDSRDEKRKSAHGSSLRGLI